ncbi:MAG: hypothetical protein ABI361_03610 [Nitrososphaera sp.]|jgi:hypothetical protein
MQRINGETIAGIALCILALLFIYAGMVNELWRGILIADLVIFAIGIGFIIVGIMSIRRTNRLESSPESAAKERHGYF